MLRVAVLPPLLPCDERRNRLLKPQRFNLDKQPHILRIRSLIILSIVETIRAPITHSVGLTGPIRLR